LTAAKFSGIREDLSLPAETLGEERAIANFFSSFLKALAAAVYMPENQKQFLCGIPIAPFLKRRKKVSGKK